MTHRDEWARTTEGSRHVAVLADAELRRRHPEAQLPPLRSAEPETPEPFLPDVADEAALAEVKGARDLPNAPVARLLHITPLTPRTTISPHHAASGSNSL